MKRIRTRHLIPYPPQQVWTVLTDFKAYAAWNPLNVWAGVKRGWEHGTVRRCRRQQGQDHCPDGDPMTMALEARGAEVCGRNGAQGRN